MLAIYVLSRSWMRNTTKYCVFIDYFMGLFPKILLRDTQENIKSL